MGVAGLAAWGSAPRPLALARRLRCPLRGLLSGWVCGVPRPSSLRAFAVVRPACAGRCLGAGFWRGVVAPGGRRGLSPVLAVCLWDSVVAPCPRLRAVAARWGAACAPVGAWVLVLAAASLHLSRLSVAVAWVLVQAGCGLVAGVRPPPRPPVRPPTGGSQSSWRSGSCTNCSTNRTYICTDDSTLSSLLPPGG